MFVALPACKLSSICCSSMQVCDVVFAQLCYGVPKQGCLSLCRGVCCRSTEYVGLTGVLCPYNGHILCSACSTHINMHVAVGSQFSHITRRCVHILLWVATRFCMCDGVACGEGRRLVSKCVGCCCCTRHDSSSSTSNPFAA